MKGNCRKKKLTTCERKISSYKPALTYVTLTEFWKLNATCNISPETTELRIWMTLKEMRHTRICGAQVFDNVFDKRESKCCAVLIKHHCKVKGEQVINLQMPQQLITKNINVVPGQLFCRQCKVKFLLETDSLYLWSR